MHTMPAHASLRIAYNSQHTVQFDADMLGRMSHGFGATVKSPLRRTPVSFNTLVVILANVLMNLIWTKTRVSRLPISEDQIITFIRFST